MDKDNKQVSQPKLTLNDEDKLYLAVAAKSSGKLTFIYTLACLKANGRQWNAIPTTEISTFDNVKDADIYFRTVSEIMAYQDKQIGNKKIKEYMKEYIKTFKKKTR